MLGAVAGSRFANTSCADVVDYLGAAFGSFAVATSVAGIFVTLVCDAAAVPDCRRRRSRLRPGAQDPMMVLALALMLDPVYVGAHHLARWLVCTFSVAVFAQIAGGRKGRRQPPPKEWTRPGQGTFDD